MILDHHAEQREGLRAAEHADRRAA
jgi:hypothetical protein